MPIPALLFLFPCLALPQLTDRLNAPLARGFGEREVRSFALTQDGEYVLYLADQDTTGVVELYGRPRDGTKPPARLNGPIHARNGSVRSFVVGRGSCALYLADQELDGVMELYGVPVDGRGVAVKLHPDLAGERDVAADFALDPGGKVAVFRADLDGSGMQLFSAPASGERPPTRLSSGSAGVSNFALAEGGARAVYRAGQRRLFAVPTDGGHAPVRISGELEAGAEIPPYFRISADGRRVLYLVDRGDGSNGLYRAAIEGDLEPVRLIDSVFAGFVVTPDSLHVFVLIDEDPSPYQAGALYRVPIDGRSKPVRVAACDPSRELLVSPDSRYVVFAAGERLYSSPVGGREALARDGRPRTLRLTPSPAPGAQLLEAAISPASDRVVFVFRHSGQPSELFSVPIDGGANPVRLNGPLVQGGSVGQGASPTQTFALSPDGRTVAYWADQDEAGLCELYAVPIDAGSPPRKVSGPLAPGQDDPSHVGSPSAVFAPDGAELVYRLDQDAPGILELHAAPNDGSRAPRRLNPPLVHVVGDVRDFALAPDGSRAVYRADGDADGVMELYSVTLRGRREVVKLNGPLAPGGNVGAPPFQLGGEDFWISSDSRRVVYRADQDRQGMQELFSAPLDGHTAAVRLGGLGCGAVELSPDGARVLYLSDELVPGVPELRGAPIDGSAPPATLNGPLVPGGAVWQFQVAPDSSRVVYVAEQDGDGDFDLYSVPLGGGSSVRLSSGGGVSAPLLSADSRAVVFLVRTPGTQELELRLAPIDGSTPAVVLARAAANRRFEAVAFAPDLSRVVFLADVDVQQVTELYSVPIDGSAPPLKLHPALSRPGVFSFALADGSSRVVYYSGRPGRLYSVPIDGTLAPAPLTPGPAALPFERKGGRVLFEAAQARDLFRLFSVPEDGSADPVELSGPLPAGASVHAFRSSLVGGWVAFSADTGADGGLELFRCRLDGSEGPIAASPPAIPHGGVDADLGYASFHFTPGAEALLFRGAMDEAGAQELYLSLLPLDARASRAPTRTVGVSGP